MLDTSSSQESNKGDSSKSGLIRVMGLWEGTNKRGQKYLSGNLNAGTRVMVFRNGFKTEGSREPDYILYVSQSQPRPQSGTGQGDSPAPEQAAHAPAPQPVPEDDIPF